MFGRPQLRNDYENTFNSNVHLTENNNETIENEATNSIDEELGLLKKNFFLLIINN